MKVRKHRKDRRNRDRPPKLTAGPRPRGIAAFLGDLGPGLDHRRGRRRSVRHLYLLAGGRRVRLRAALDGALLSFPLMLAVQLMCARLGARHALGARGRAAAPLFAVAALARVLLLLVGNTINIAADLRRHGRGRRRCCPARRTRLVRAGVRDRDPALPDVRSYSAMLRIFKWLTLVLFAYVIGGVSREAGLGRRGPRHVRAAHRGVERLPFTFVAIFGTTISPTSFSGRRHRRWRRSRRPTRGSAIDRSARSSASFEARAPTCSRGCSSRIS